MNRMTEGKQSKTTLPARKQGNRAVTAATRYSEGGTSTQECELDQSTKETTRGAGEARRTEAGSTAREGRQHGKHRGPHKHSEEHKPTETTSPRRQRKHEDTSTTGQHKQTAKGQTRRQRTAQTQQKRGTLRRTRVRRSDRRTEERRGELQKEANQTNRIKEHKCTSHIYGQTHKYKCKARPYYRESKTPMHLPRLWTDAPVAKQTQVDSTGKDAKSRKGTPLLGPTGAKGAHQSEQGGQSRD